MIDLKKLKKKLKTSVKMTQRTKISLAMLVLILDTCCRMKLFLLPECKPSFIENALTQ